MNECEKYELLISRLIDSDLNEEEKSALAQHLESCPHCRFIYESFKALSENLPSAEEELPEGLHEEIMAKLRRGDIKKKNSGKLSAPLKTLIAAAACVAVIVGVGIGLRPDLSTASAPESMNAAVFSAESGTGAENTVSGADYSPAEEAAPQAEEELSTASLRDGADVQEYSDTLSEEAPILKNRVLSIPVPLEESDDDQVISADTLSGESFDSLLVLLAGTLSDTDPALISADGAVGSVLCDDGRSLSFYLYEGSLYYSLSSSGYVYTAGCADEEIADFLNQK